MAKNTQRETRLKGLALSNGSAVGGVCMFNENRHSNLPMYKIQGGGSELEMGRVKRAIEIAGDKLEEIRADVEKTIGAAEAEIFVAHKMILQDPELISGATEKIKKENLNAESAVSQVLNTYEKRLQDLDDEYIRERATDIGEIRRRLLDVMGNMSPSLQCDTAHCQKGRNRIVVAGELTPSLTVDIDPQFTMGFVTERGGINSHAAILARAMGIPAVSALPGIREQVGCGTELLVNGTTGEVVIWPSEETVSAALAAATLTRGLPEPLEPVEGLKVMANVNLAPDVQEAIRMKAEGIGLYRTEFEIMAAGRFLSENEMYERYRTTITAMAGKPTTFRLFDIGSDKSMPFMKIPREENPSLGWRGARLLLGRRDVLETQAMALARASEGSRIHVMYPMIVDVDQFLEIRQVFQDATRHVRKGEILHGVMFEVPSACLQARELFDVADFASVGSNDLTQYLFAVDRENDLVSYDYRSDRPVFWRLLKDMAQAAQAAGKPLSICGELAGDPQYLPKLTEVGIGTISVSARRISDVRKAAAEAAGNVVAPVS